MATLSAPLFQWTTTASGPWASNAAVTAKVIRHVDQVIFMLLTPLSGSFSASNAVVLSESLPASFRPPVNLSFTWPVFNNPGNEHGLLTISASTGTVTWNSSANGGTFANGANPVGVMSSSVTWLISP